MQVGISYLPIPGVMKGKEENGPNDKMLIQVSMPGPPMLEPPAGWGVPRVPSPKDGYVRTH